MRRVGITQRVEVDENHGEVRDCLDQAWSVLAARYDVVLIPLCNGVIEVSRYLEELDLHGVILSGGNDFADLPGTEKTSAARDMFEQHLLEWCQDHSRPVLGVCRGMQGIHRFFGGELKRVSGHVARSHDILFNGESFKVNSFHRWGIGGGTVAPRAEIVAMGQSGTVEAFIFPQEKMAGMMWHPERESSPSTPSAEMLARFMEWVS